MTLPSQIIKKHLLIHLAQKFIHGARRCEPHLVDVVRKQKQLILQNDPLLVLEANQIVGNLLPNVMDSRPGRLGKLSRLLTIKHFGNLYCNHFNLLAETMTLEEVSKNIEWDTLLRPRPKTCWIRYQRYLNYFWNRVTLLTINPEYVPTYVNPRPIGELIALHHQRGTWVSLSPVTGQYKRLRNIQGDHVPTRKAIFHGCMEAALWYMWKLWPQMSITVYPTEFALLTLDIPEIQNHFRKMRTDDTTWGRSLLNNHDGG